MDKIKLALVGATGLVGTVVLELLEQRGFPVDELLPVASARSVGKTVRFNNKDHKIISIEEAIEQKPQLAIFSAGGATSLQFAERFAAAGTTVVDNSSAWRMDPSKKLIIPEINASELEASDKIIANPNCSTIQMLLALAPIHSEYGIERIVVSTYQSITGTGVKAVHQLENEEKGIDGEQAYPHPIFRNCIPQCDVFEDNGYTKEEMKMFHETQKIMSDPSLKVSATAVRVPVVGGHSESINLRLKKDYKLEELKTLLENSPGIVVQDNPDKLEYPMPINSHGSDAVFVGRIRRDFSEENSLNLWVVSDNLRKGAATNAIQICEHLLSNELIS